MPKAYIQLGANGSSPSICPARATGCAAISLNSCHSWLGWIFQSLLLSAAAGMQLQCILLKSDVIYSLFNSQKVSCNTTVSKTQIAKPSNTMDCKWELARILSSSFPTGDFSQLAPVPLVGVSHVWTPMWNDAQIVRARCRNNLQEIVLLNWFWDFSAKERQPRDASWM